MSSQNSSLIIPNLPEITITKSTGCIVRRNSRNSSLRSNSVISSDGFGTSTKYDCQTPKLARRKPISPIIVPNSPVRNVSLAGSNHFSIKTSENQQIINGGITGTKCSAAVQELNQEVILSQTSPIKSTQATFCSNNTANGRYKFLSEYYTNKILCCMFLEQIILW